MELLIIVGGFLSAALTIIVFRKQRAVARSTSLLASIIALIYVLFIALKVADMKIYSPFPLFSIDGLGAIILLIIALIGLVTNIYSLEYFRQEKAKHLIGSTRIKQYFILLNLFLAAMVIAVSTNNPIIAWISIEATTLSTAFLISFYNKSSAIEAAWKYLIINSIGLLLGFFGTLLYFIPVSELLEKGEMVSWYSLMSQISHLDPMIAKIAFIFVLIGYGTKVGMVPMHTWKPSAYTKAPTPLGALLSGALLPVAFMMILRLKVLTDIAAGPSFSQNLLIGFGLLSIAVSSFIIPVLTNYKRLLAYSSIENAGIMALGFGFGGIGIMAAMLHMIYHSLIKSALFLSSGNILLKYHSARIKDIKGAMTVIPISSIIFMVGFLAITGAPPFGVLMSKILILSAGMKQYPVVSIVALLCMEILFFGFLKHTSAMLFGDKPDHTEPEKENVWLIIPPLALLLVVLYLSFSLPIFLQKLLHHAVNQF